MINLNDIKKVIDWILSKFVADSNKNYLRLRFGTYHAVLGSRSFMLLNSKRPLFEQDMIHWRKKRGNLFISPKFEPNPHIVISGMSGFGKSTLFKSLLLDIRKANVACIIFDAHNEHSDIVKSLNGNVHNALCSGINLLELDGASVSERISELSRLFKEIYSLGYIQTTKLSECLWYTYRKAGARGRGDRVLRTAPSIKDLIDEFNIFIKNAKGIGERNTLLHLRDRFSLLNSSAFNGSFIDMNGINKGIHSFSLASMKSKYTQLIYISELLNRLYAKMHDSSKQHGLRLYIMIDETQFLVDNSNNNSVIAKLIEEGRKYGVGVIIVTHAASTLNRKIMANCSTFVTFYAREPSEVSYISKVLSCNNAHILDAVRNRIGQLKQNQAMLVSSCIRTPAIVSTPKFDEIKINGSSAPVESEIINIIRTGAKRPMKKEELATIANIQDGILTKMINSGAVDRLTLHTNGTDEEWFMTHNNSLSIEHEVWVRKLSDLLSLNSIKSMTLDNSNGPDIVAVNNGKRIAIEYETGSKSLKSSLIMMDSRLDKYDKTIIVTNEPSLQYYKDNFESKGITVISTGHVEAIINLVLSIV